MGRHRLLVHSAKQIVQVVNNGARVLAGDAMKTLAVLEADNTEGLSIVVNSEGKIQAIGTDTEVKAKILDWEFDKIIDATGKSIIPGLVDGHTHSIWTGDRVHEFAMKLAGATYMEVHEAGGGIHFTVDRVREASEDKLYEEFKGYLQRMLETGTTLVEVKSGYGLDAETELKMLRVMDRGIRDPDVKQDISATYCGAHAIPKGGTAEAAVEDILKNHLPKIRALRDAGELHVHNFDVFCEKGVFDVDQSRRMLKAGKCMGLALNFHAEELNQLHSAEMGAELGARAMSHLEEVSEEGMVAMAKAGTVGVLLPTTAYILRLRPPPAREMINKGVSLALGSDFNPNAHCLSMPLVMHLACVILRLSMPEALVAATLNAAASLGRSHIQGSLERGKLGDMLILNSHRWEHLIYQLGSHDKVLGQTVKNGIVVHEN